MADSREPRTPMAILVHPGTDPADAARDGRPVRVLAGARRRVVARLIDHTSVLVAWAAAVALVLVMPDEVPDALAVVLAVAFPLTAIGGAFFLRVALVVLWGCTVGQRIAGIRVLHVDGIQRPTWGQAIDRWKMTWGSQSSPGVGPWDDVIAFAKDDTARRCFHDERALTVVVLAEPPAPADAEAWWAREWRVRILLGVVSVLVALVVAAPIVAYALADSA